MDKKYQILYTESAIRDIEEKVDYISFNLHDPDLAETWYLRLKAEILKDLTQFPCKYPLYHIRKWSAKGIRQFTFRNDVILYSVNEKEQIVYIRAVCTNFEIRTMFWGLVRRWFSAAESKLSDTVEEALKQIEEKQYETALTAKGIPKERIRKYGFAFRGKTVLIGGI